MEEEGQEPGTFGVAAYLAAVAVGCVLAGGFLPISNVLLGYGIQLKDFLLHPFFALLVGFLPGVVLCLPVALLSFWRSRRLRLVTEGWYALFGGATGLWVGVLFALAMASTMLVAFYQVAVFSIAGSAAGLVYCRIKKLKDAWQKRLRKLP